jgi:metal-responsive CopG/Arc/MetJ family transcriptional regulator
MSTKTVHIVLDDQLLRPTNRAARGAKQSRSALIRDALRRHLRALEIHRQEERDRRGYAMHPQAAKATWPEG